MIGAGKQLIAQYVCVVKLVPIFRGMFLVMQFIDNQFVVMLL